MKKISLITLQYINNYGSVLQTYASQEYLRKHGYSVEVVNYTRENCRFDNLKKSMKAYYSKKGSIFALPFVSQLLTMRWERLYKKRNKVFDEFRKNSISLSDEYSSIEDLTQNPPIADCYCVGSDQVWNYLYNDGVLPEYFLSYAPSGKKKFALASSLGIEKIEDSDSGNLIKEYLEGFDLITVREKSAEQALVYLGCDNVYQILDPTLLLSKGDWTSKFDLCNSSNAPYVLVYQLNPCKEMDEFAQAVAAKKNCRLIVISNNIRLSIPGAEIIDNPTVEQFLSLILHSECMITDSFHGTAFSLNFNKDFFSWMPQKYSTRLSSILELTGLSERAFSKNDARWELVEKIDYQKVNAVLQEWRDNADRLIAGVLSK